MEPSANHTFNANITPKSAPYPFVDFVSLDNHRIDFNMIMSFDVVNDDYIPTARGIFQLCDGNSLLNGPEPTNYTFMKRFEGFMTKIGTNETWPVAIDIIYDNGFYCYYVTNLRADNLILTAGDEWTIKCHGSYPFFNTVFPRDTTNQVTSCMSLLSLFKGLRIQGSDLLFKDFLLQVETHAIINHFSFYRFFFLS